MQTWSKWHHAPAHSFSEGGWYFVTAGTLHKLHHFRSSTRLDLLANTLLVVAEQFEWQMAAWAVFSNHYHFVAGSATPTNLPRMIQALHSKTAIAVNRLDGTPGRQVLYQYRDTKLSDETAYLTRYKYVHLNAVHHKLVSNASAYKWCSAADFMRCASAAEINRLDRLKIDRVKVIDPFDPVLEDY